MYNALCSWSGGKDSCFALIKSRELGYTPKVLLNVLNEEGKISRSHGIPSDILIAQANAAGLPIHMVKSSWQDYEKNFTAALSLLKNTYDLQAAIFGDIDLQAHRDWEEKVCSNAGLKAVLPIWKEERKNIILQVLHSGIKTMIVSCNDVMGEIFLGKVLNEDVIKELENLGVDVCGENGEFHTLVLECSLFTTPLQVNVTRSLKHEHYWFSELELVQ